jgi:hypothetical protein
LSGLPKSNQILYRSPIGASVSTQKAYAKSGLSGWIRRAVMQWSG